MRTLLALLLVGGLCTLGLGCGGKDTKKSDKAADKKGTDDDKKGTDDKGTDDKGTDKGAKEGSVTLSTGKPSFTVDKGKTANAMIMIKRTEYEGPLTLTFEAPEKSGLKVTAKPVGEGKEEAEATIDAKGVKPGTYDVKITATAEKGLKEPAEGTLKVTVK
ncbi:MAG TPA: hypothetical protein VG013_26405 [Gemmataceae bacterium]|nr:hypothetical protein [Gemmataceae bacterium]